jgi:acetyl esterase/lipase
MHDPRTAGLVVPVPDDQRVLVRRDQVCEGPNGTALPFDVYLPVGDGGGRPPLVVFVHGDAPPELLQGAKDWAQFRDWGRLVAGSGLAAVTFNRSSTQGFTRVAEAEAEVQAMLHHLQQHAWDYGFDAERLGVCAFSAGPPTVIPWLLREQPRAVRCIVVYYGLLDLQPPSADPSAPAVPASVQRYSAASTLRDLSRTEGVAPMLVLRAGRDRPALNENLDRFVMTALERNLPLEVFNHPDGEHAFDVRNDHPRTREAIRRTLDFFRWSLLQRT